VGLVLCVGGQAQLATGLLFTLVTLLEDVGSK